MANFIEFKDTYNPLTSQGERLKYINVDQIVYVEPLTEYTYTNKRIPNGLQSRICLSTGELLDVRETFDDITKKLLVVKTKISE